VNPRAAAQRRCEGRTTQCPRGAAWAAAHRVTATAVALAGTPAAAAAIHRDPRMLAYATAAWTWAAWRRPTPPHKPPTSDDSGKKGNRAPVGEGMSIIKTVNGTAVSRPHPTDPDRTVITWETP
jgi:hypothetical protein